jgi:predicted RNase H-like HicB family nuclease/uncharacterized damage-inducible protein DinB
MSAGYSACIEVADGDGCLAHVVELPGCRVFAATPEQAIEALPEAITRHRHWRHQHGLPCPDTDPTIVRVRQVVEHVRPWTPYGAGALFGSDRELLDDANLDLYLQVLAAARLDLLTTLQAMPRGLYDEQLGGLPMTIRQMCLHLAETEVWIVSRIGRVVVAAEPDPIRRMIDVRARTLEHIARYDREDRDLVYIPTERHSSDPEEAWTLRKVLRRLIEHEFDHLDDARVALAHWQGGSGHE